MAKKILFSVVLFALTLSLIVPLQQVGALEPRTVFDNMHRSASFGNSPICGDHKCAPGEKPLWTHATWGSQRLGSGKIPSARHGEDIMAELAKASANATSMQANKNMSYK